MINQGMVSLHCTYTCICMFTLVSYLRARAKQKKNIFFVDCSKNAYYLLNTSRRNLRMQYVLTLLIFLSYIFVFVPHILQQCFFPFGKNCLFNAYPFTPQTYDIQSICDWNFSDKKPLNTRKERTKKIVNKLNIFSLASCSG